jgi:hypothetical protein
MQRTTQSLWIQKQKDEEDLTSVPSSIKLLADDSVDLAKRQANKPIAEAMAGQWDSSTNPFWQQAWCRMIATSVTTVVRTHVIGWNMDQLSGSAISSSWTYMVQRSSCLPTMSNVIPSTGRWLFIWVLLDVKNTHSVFWRGFTKSFLARAKITWDTKMSDGWMRGPALMSECHEYNYLVNYQFAYMSIFVTFVVYIFPTIIEKESWMQRRWGSWLGY